MRPAYLKGACGEDRSLRERVEALLQAHANAGQFLQGEDPSALSRPDANETQRINRSEGPGGLIGRYKLLQEIGEGGFGVVYMAEQREPVKRRVALKIIKLGMDTKQVIGRFEAERQALAMMDHPNIAKVLDGGATETGRPFFVMELVRGVPPMEFCDEHHLTPTERLNLFMQVCNAIQHAHQKGVVHRDIKPSNVMITKGVSGGVIISAGPRPTSRKGADLPDHRPSPSESILPGRPLTGKPDAGKWPVRIGRRGEIAHLAPAPIPASGIGFDCPASHGKIALRRRMLASAI